MHSTVALDATDDRQHLDGKEYPPEIGVLTLYGFDNIVYSETISCFASETLLSTVSRRRTKTKKMGGGGVSVLVFGFLTVSLDHL